MIKINVIVVFMVFFFQLLIAQEKKEYLYTKALDLNVFGKVQPTSNYHRLDTGKYPDLPLRVKNLLTNSAGLVIGFKTTSPSIAVKWCVAHGRTLPNMTAIAEKGLDLYIKDGDKWIFAGAGSPKANCNEAVLVNNLDKTEKECLLYLPLYNELKELAIGIEPETSLATIVEPFRKKILIYGSSIAQGASASRPGLAYPALLSRATGLHFINMGLSGSAKMEKSVADVLAATEADAYILDCVPNSSPEEIEERTAYLVRAIRAKHPQAPIIIVQSIVRESGYWDRQAGERVRRQNENIRLEYEKLKRSGVKNLYFIPSKDFLGDDHEGTIDGTHPNDLGFGRMVALLGPELIKILKNEGVF